MCDIRTLRRIEKVIEAMMAFKQMFTAFDITLLLQKKGMSKRHSEIRRDIKRVAVDLMWRFGYDRTLVRFQEVDAHAFVFHPYGTDASLHQPSLCPGALARPRNRKRIAAVTDSPQPVAPD